MQYSRITEKQGNRNGTGSKRKEWGRKRGGTDHHIFFFFFIFFLFKQIFMHTAKVTENSRIVANPNQLPTYIHKNSTQQSKLHFINLQ